MFVIGALIGAHSRIMAAEDIGQPLRGMRGE